MGQARCIFHLPHSYNLQILLARGNGASTNVEPCPHCLGLYPDCMGMWEICHWLGKAVFFAWYSGFLHHVQLASHDLTAMAEKMMIIRIPNSLSTNHAARLRILALLILATRKSYRRETGLCSVNAGLQGFYTSLRNAHYLNNTFSARFLSLKGKVVWCK